MLSRQSIMHEAGETGTCTGTISGPSSVPDTLDLATPPGRLMFQIVGVMAEFEGAGPGSGCVPRVSCDLSIFDSPGRDERLQINRVMDILGIGPVKAVADIGAGSGWFTVRAAKRVGDTGTMYAVDINPEAIRYIESR